MERLIFSQNLSRAFETWKAGQPTTTDISNLNQAIGFAMSNGFDLTLKIPKDVLDETTTTRPMSGRDAEEFSTREENGFFVFDIPSEQNRSKVQYRKRYYLIAVENFRDRGPSILLKSNFAGVFGVFRPDEVISLNLK